MNTFLRPHMPPPPAPTKKDAEIDAIVAGMDFNQSCIHDAAALRSFVREAYEAGQRDPLPEPIGPSDNHTWTGDE